MILIKKSLKSIVESALIEYFIKHEFKINTGRYANHEINENGLYKFSDFKRTASCAEHCKISPQKYFANRELKKELMQLSNQII